MPPVTPSKLVISTTNRHKLDEIRAIMADLAIELISLDAYPTAPAVVEDADTLEGNAAKKSQALFVHTGLPTVADDTGLEVLALDGAPGVYSARYAGPDSNDAANRKKLLHDLDQKDDRRAQFRTVIAFTTSKGTFLFEGACKGQIITHERGNKGFGYDALFVPEGFETTFAEMTSADKNAISHRGRALRTFASYLANLIT